MFVGRENSNIVPTDDALCNGFPRIEGGKTKGRLQACFVHEIIQLDQAGARLHPGRADVASLWEPFGDDALREFNSDIHGPLLSAVEIDDGCFHALQSAK